MRKFLKILAVIVLAAVVIGGICVLYAVDKIVFATTLVCAVASFLFTLFYNEFYFRHTEKKMFPDDTTYGTIETICKPIDEPDEDKPEYELNVFEDGTAEITYYNEPNAKDGTVDLIIPDTIDGHTITAIGSYAFVRNYSLKSVTLPCNISKIGFGAFFGNIKLRKVFGLNHVEEIGDYAFSKCGFMELKLDSSLCKMGKGVFECCIDLKKVSATVDVISECAFDYCFELAKVDLVTTKIEQHAFSKCEKLKEVRISERNEGDFKEIGDYAFKGCTSLKRVYLPNSKVKMGKDVFDDFVISY